jgi:hypothetical protein
MHPWHVIQVDDLLPCGLVIQFAYCRTNILEIVGHKSVGCLTAGVNQGLQVTQNQIAWSRQVFC